MPAPGSEAMPETLNRAQRRAVTSAAPTVAILAGPGSGKTHTLTSRVVWLIQQMGYSPADVIVATFTVKAAKEMKERIEKRLGKAYEQKIVLGTFHSIARRYLAAYGNRIGLNPKFAIADDGDSRAIIQRIIKRLDLRIETAHAKSWISKRKSRGTTPLPGKRQQENPSLNICFAEYQQHLARANLLDYDDLLVRCVELLQHHPACVSNVQAVLIDEYQDTNGIQYDLMRLFAQTRQRITIVGDPDQSIYGWRSAEIKNLYRLLRDYPQTDEISLEENYRSSQHILNTSLQVIQQDEKRYKKVLLPVHAKGTKPVLRKLRSSSAEGEWIVSELRRITTMFGGLLKNEDVAILLRSASLSRHIESALGKSGISYRMVGGLKFYERKEIKILLDYLRVVYQPNNNDAVSRIINTPRRGVGEATVKSLLEEAEKSNLSLWAILWRHCRGGRQLTTKIRPSMEQKLNTELLRVISTLRSKAEHLDNAGESTLVGLIEHLVTLLNFKCYLETEYEEDHEQRWANVQELLNLAGDFMRDFGAGSEEALPTIEDVGQVGNDDVLGRFLANVALASDAQSSDTQQDKSSDVTISTIHAAKGLEWPVVFIPSVYEGSIPHSRAEDMDEERRLLYVAMTRAKALLYLSCPLYGSQGLSNKVELSPFITSFAGAFDQKGPSFDSPVVETVGKMLNRMVPDEKSTFDQIPPMFCIEDTQFPIDPFDPKDANGLDLGNDHCRSRVPKRQKTQNTLEGGGDAAHEEKPWKPDYSTTMEQSAAFTMAASMPGFVTAGAHQLALNAAGVPSAFKSNSADKTNLKRGGQGATASRRADQKSLLGFVTTASSARKSYPADKATSRYQAAASRASGRLAPQAIRGTDESPSIDAEFTKHKIAGAKPVFRMGASRLTDDKAGGEKNACFSSSPTREASPEAGVGEQAPKQVLQRPAASFHSTTFMSMKPVGGVRRPVGLGPPPSMDRLRKPFKPPTINRPQGQSGKLRLCAL
ncbi:uncharacterized protein UV8b_05340 [Ustilaginoidea virens]|uniref:DNA 3'-5' helicase n=1 Tax=Ustilaginoidea virens TaxID=1159556 RepID=A0A8E5MIZ7_USTVR|nr:uncharacterized protein UV8b_05340 [Ustilaginoidea virens]QUC21097.1 hypothetical protein UV8b_05340 [Ustilaginoidea virens]